MAADLPNYNVKSIFALLCVLFGNNWTEQLHSLGNTERFIDTSDFKFSKSLVRAKYKNIDVEKSMIRIKTRCMKGKAC